MVSCRFAFVRCSGSGLQRVPAVMNREALLCTCANEWGLVPLERRSQETSWLDANSSKPSLLIFNLIQHFL